MSRPLRISYPGAWYHVMNRGRRHENIFLEEGDYALFLQILKDASSMWNLEVSAYCLMGNHYHILVRTPDANISRCMRHLNGVYTQRFNRKHGFDGQLFRGRYKAVLVQEDSHLLELLRYIHRNPVKANIAERIEDYQWSSHKAYLKDSAKWDWLQRGHLLELLSKSRKQAFTAYMDFVDQEDSEEVTHFFSKKNLPSIFGSSGFIEKIKSRFGHLTENTEIAETQILTVCFDDVAQAVCTVYGVSHESLLKYRRGEKNIARDLAIYLMRRHSGQTLTQVGGCFGIDSYSTVSSAIQRVKKDITQDKELQTNAARIEKLLLKGQRQT